MTDLKKYRETESVIVSGDPHVLKRAGMWAGRSDISGDDVFALSQTVDLCLETRSDLVLLGDNLDCRENTVRPVSILVYQLGRLISAGLKVYYIEGNHDRTGDVPWLSILGPNCVHVGSKEFTLLDKKCFGLDYFGLPESTEILDSVPSDTEWLFLHGTAKSAYWVHDFDEVQLKPSITRCFCGHYHTPYRATTESGCDIVYPGSTWGVTAPERHQKKVLLVTSADMVELSILERSVVVYSEHRKLSTEELVELMVSRTYETLPPEIRRPILLVDIPAPQDLINSISKVAHVYSLSTANQAVPSKTEIAVSAAVTDEEILLELVDKNTNPVEFAFISDVLQRGAEEAMLSLRNDIGITDELVKGVQNVG